VGVVDGASVAVTEGDGGGCADGCRRPHDVGNNNVPITAAARTGTARPFRRFIFGSITDGDSRTDPC
jgi:hypothetical protein